MDLLRHCAFCLVELRADAVKKCGKCHRRVYCSKVCQERDWNGKFPKEPTTPVGQGHKNWCGKEYGEEDLDWKVVPMEGRCGIVALRPIPPKYRIMVDACQVNLAHPGTKDLMPLHGTIEETVMFNNFSSDREGYESKELCMRMSRLNHSCKPNASHQEVVVKGFKVKVVYAEQEIKAGEEILICSPHRGTRPEGTETITSVVEGNVRLNPRLTQVELRFYCAAVKNVVNNRRYQVDADSGFFLMTGEDYLIVADDEDKGQPERIERQDNGNELSLKFIFKDGTSKAVKITVETPELVKALNTERTVEGYALVKFFTALYPPSVRKIESGNPYAL